MGREIASSHCGTQSKEVNSSLFVTALIVDVTKRCFWATMWTDNTDSYPAREVDDDVEPGFGPANGGLRGSRELQGGRMLIIKRPQVAKFMFIWAARRKSFPVKRNGDPKYIYILNIPKDMQVVRTEKLATVWSTLCFDSNLRLEMNEVTSAHKI